MTPLYLLIGVVLAAIRQIAVGVIIILIAFGLLWAAPWFLKELYGGKFWFTEVRLGQKEFEYTP